MAYSVLGVIPARYGSARFPGKVLAPLHGRPIIEWVWRQAKKAAIDDAWIATDDERVAEAARAFGAHVVMTSPECASGSDRIAQAIADVDVEMIVNIQGDEPQMDPRTIDRAVGALRNDAEAVVATAMVRLHNLADFNDPNVVKVVVSQQGRALYFSRSPLPSLARVEQHTAEGGCATSSMQNTAEGGCATSSMQNTAEGGCATEMRVKAYKHLGLYVYRKEALQLFAKLPQTPLERVEKLEQLRYLENGYAIQVIEAASDSIGVDTPGDLEHLARIFHPEQLP